MRTTGDDRHRGMVDDRDEYIFSQLSRSKKDDIITYSTRFVQRPPDLYKIYWIPALLWLFVCTCKSGDLAAWSESSGALITGI